MALGGGPLAPIPGGGFVFLHAIAKIQPRRQGELGLAVAICRCLLKPQKTRHIALHDAVALGAMATQGELRPRVAPLRRIPQPRDLSVAVEQLAQRKRRHVIPLTGGFFVPHGRLGRVIQPILRPQPRQPLGRRVTGGSSCQPGVVIGGVGFEPGIGRRAIQRTSLGKHARPVVLFVEGLRPSAARCRREFSHIHVQGSPGRGGIKGRRAGSQYSGKSAVSK